MREGARVRSSTTARDRTGYNPLITVPQVWSAGTFRQAFELFARIYFDRSKE